MESSLKNKRASHDGLSLDESHSSSPLFGHSTTTLDNTVEELVNVPSQGVPTDNTAEKDPSSTISDLMRSRRSDIWIYFNIVLNAETGKLDGICKYCAKTYDASPRAGTSNFHTHIKKCKEYKKMSSTENSTHGKEIDQKVFRRLLAEALMRHGYSFSWVEHEATRKIFKYLNDSVEPITRNTIQKECVEMHVELKEKIMHVLKGLPGRICLTSDLWTACTSRGYLCVTTHYIDENWKLNSKLLCFKHCAPPHGGYELSVQIANVMLERGIEKKIFSLTYDNASNMDKMIWNFREGAQKDLLCKGKYFHVRCAAHILNLIVKKGLEMINAPLVKLRDCIKYIVGSEARKLRFLDLCKQIGVTYTCGLWLDVVTRWNSTYIMIERAFRYRDVLHHFFGEMDEKYHIGHDEWVQIEEICQLLKPFYEITTLFSGSDYPTANVYFPKVFKIHCSLQNTIRGPVVEIGDEFDDAEKSKISLAATEIMRKFEKYWHEYVMVLTFAVIFDPQYKFGFVKFALTGTHGVERGEQLAKEVHIQLVELYKEYENLVRDGDSDSISNFRGAKRFRSERPFHYDKIEEFEFYEPCDISKSELDIYLVETRLKCSKDFDVLDYWKTNSTRFPILSSMARDILAILITSIASESTFSMGGRILNKCRISLTYENVEALVTTNNWLTGYDDFTEEGQGIFVKLSTNDSCGEQK